MREIYRASDDSTLHGVDNLWWDEPGQRLFVAEDGDDLELIMLDRPRQDRSAAPAHRARRLRDHRPDARSRAAARCLFSSQRGATGTGRGMTFAVTGPFATT